MSSKRFPQTIMATVCLPWTKDFRLDEALLVKEIESIVANDVKTLYLFGTAGEGYSVDDPTFKRVVDVFEKTMRGCGGTTPIVGVIGTSFDAMKSRIDYCADKGIGDFQISFPCWGAPTDAEVMNFFHGICDAFPGMRFMHYNNGARSRRMLTASEYRKIADEIPNLVSVKNPGAGMAEIIDCMRADLPIQFFFMESTYGYASLYGESALLISILNMNYKMAHAYFEAGRKRDIGTITKIDRDCRCVMDAFGLLSGGRIDAAYDKFFVKYMIPEFPHRLNPPYVGFSEEEFAKFDASVRRSIPDWFEEC